MRTPSRRTGRLGRQLTRRTTTSAYVGNTVDSVENPPGNDPHSILQTPEISHLPFEDPGPHIHHHGGPPPHHRLHQHQPDKENKIKKIINKLNAEDITENKVNKKEETTKKEEDKKKDSDPEARKKENPRKRVSNHVAQKQFSYLMGPGSEAGAPPGRPEYSAGGTGDGLSTSSPSSSSIGGGRAWNTLRGSSIKVKLGKYPSSTDVCYCLGKCSCSVAAEISSSTALAGTDLKSLGGKTTTAWYENNSFERIFVQKGDQLIRFETSRPSQGIKSKDHLTNINPDVSSQKTDEPEEGQSPRAN